jgi:cytochrome c6
MNRSFVRGTWAIAVIAAASFLYSTPLQAQDDGASLFKAKCSACHGADGSGNTKIGQSLKMLDLGSPEVQKETDAQLTDMITAGKGAMPAYKGKLTAAEVMSLVAYIRTLAKK